MSLPEQWFDRLLSAEPSRPFVTYYDEASGERTELSVRSTANWVAKTHHLLVDELGLGAGDTALIALPAHWISVPVLLGCLSAGLALSAGRDAGNAVAAGAVADADVADAGAGYVADADVAFVTPATAPVATGATGATGASASAAATVSTAPVADVYAVDPAAAAVGFRDAPPPGCADYVTSVRPHADAWPGAGMWAQPADPCLPGLTRDQTCAQAQRRAAELGLQAGGRLLCTRDWDGPQAWLDTLLAPLAVGASVVYVRNLPDGPAGAELLARRAAQERTTALLR